MTVPYYTFKDGQLFFTYYPTLGKVSATNAQTTYMAIEHFVKRGFDIDWHKTRVGQLLLYVVTPEHLTEEETKSIICTTKDELVNSYKEDKLSSREKLILNNIDNNTGKPLSEKSLMNTMSAFHKDNHDRYYVANWFNQFNIEKERPNKPIIIVSTKCKSVVVKEGRKVIMSLFNKGELRKLTPEQRSERDSKVEEDILEKNTKEK